MDSNPESASEATHPLGQFVFTSVSVEMAVLVALTVLFPFLVHLVPPSGTVPLGARLLPIFYAPCIATLVGRKATAILVALLAPWANWLVTSYPAPAGVPAITLQLVTFVAVLASLGRVRGRWLLGPLAYLVGLAVSSAASLLVPAFFRQPTAPRWLLHTVEMAVPGLMVLVALGYLVRRTYPTVAR